ncbi:hypothetical protein D3C77_303400 [compost metagenome]
MLYTAMRNPIAAVIIKNYTGRLIHPRTVMNRAEMSVRILGLDNLKQSIPLTHGFLIHKIIFIGQRPPYVAERSKPGYDITQISLICFRRHPVKAPSSFIIRMKKDKIRFDSQLKQLINMAFQSSKEGGVESHKIKPFLWTAFVRKFYRIGGIEAVILRKYSHAQLVKRRPAKRIHRTPSNVFRLMNPSITRRPKWMISCSIRITEMSFVFYLNVTVIVCGGSCTFKCTRYTMKLQHPAICYVGPDPDIIRHEPQPVYPVSIVKSLHLNGLRALLEDCAPYIVTIRITLFWSRNSKLKSVPLLYNS